jgi:hypothetical protein
LENLVQDRNGPVIANKDKDKKNPLISIGQENTAEIRLH